MKILPSVVIGVVTVAVAAGFFMVGSPLEQRLRRFDERRVSDLQTIQWEIINYWQKKQSLPVSLSMLRDDIRGFVPPQDPETAAEYEYALQSANSFSVCAVFSMPIAANTISRTIPMAMDGDTWAHGAGRTCFNRTIDKDLYPPFPKPLPVIQ